MNLNKFLTLGNLNGPNISIIARPGYIETITVQDAIDIVADSRSVWKSIDYIGEVLSEDQVREICPRSMLVTPSFFGITAGNVEEDETVTPIIVIFCYPPEMTPEEALKSIEIHEKGVLSPSLAVGLLAIAPSIISKEIVINGWVYGFVRIAGKIPASGISHLSEKSIQERVREYINVLVTDGAEIDAHLPESAVDRAKFLVTLAEICWKPDIHCQISQAIKNIGSLYTLSMIATPWLLLHPKESVEVAGIRIQIKADLELVRDPWLQSLEWVSHQISADSIKFLLTPEGHFNESFYFNFLMGYPETVKVIAMELAKILLEDASVKTTDLPKYFRITLPDFYYLELSEITCFRVCGEGDRGFWVGIETDQGISASFWWRPQAEMPVGWITGLMDDELRSFIHLTLAAIWRDLAYWRETDFPYLNLPHYTGIQAYEWGRQEKNQRMRETVRRVARETNHQFWNLPALEAAQVIFKMAVQYFGPRPKLVGRTCLALLMQFCDPDLGGF